MAPDLDESDLLDKKSTKIIQSIVGTFYIIPGQLIQNFYEQSMKYQGYNKNQQGTPGQNISC